MKLSVVVCTYNRGDLLEHCLNSLVTQKASVEDFEIIVVNNNSTDNTEALVQPYVDNHTNFRLILEMNQGLSHARNRGYKEAKSDWIAYIDDDAKAHPNFVSRAISTYEQNDFQFFGGRDLLWYRFGKPYWYKDKYEILPLDYSEVSTLKSNDFARGCVMVISRKLLFDYDGFSTKLGMNGDTVAYGEETDLQLRYRNDGGVIGYDPELKVDHLVADYKMTLEWYFTSRFALGRDRVEMLPKVRKSGYLFFTLLLLFARTGLNLIIHSPKLLSSKYYIQNWLVDVFKKPVKYAGILYTAWVRKSEEKYGHLSTPSENSTETSE